MNTIYWLVLFLFATFSVSGQYFQQDIAYALSGNYNKEVHKVDATMSITYTNNSPAPIKKLYVHLWANAFSTKKSPYADQAIKLGQTDFYFAKEDKMGGYEKVQFQVNGRDLDLVYETDEIAYITLPEALPTGDAVTIDCNYVLKMPYKFDRLGWTTDGVQLVHWYPSIAHYDQKGWHTMPYLSMGEHYPTIADYTVDLNLPYEHHVSSGTLGGPQQKSITDYAIVARDKAAVNSFTIDDLSVDVMHNNNQIVLDNIQDYLSSALEYFEKHIGPYPHDKLSVVETNESGGMEYGALITLGAKDKKTFHYYLIHELLHQWFYGTIVTDQRKSGWIDEGFTTYFQQRYFKEVLGYDHYTNIAPPIYGSKPAVLKRLVPIQAKRQFDQPLCTHIDHVSAINYGINSYEIPARWIYHLEQMMGQKNFDNAIKDLMTKWGRKHPKEEDIQAIFEEHTEKSLDWFFTDMVYKKWTTDYTLEKKGTKLVVDNNTSLRAPYQLSIVTPDSTSTLWHEGHTDQKVYDVANTILHAELDPQHSLLEVNEKNNSLKRKAFSIVPFLGIDKASKNELYFAPLLNYNSSDGLTSGMAFYNSTITPKRFKFLIAPQYGWKSKDVVGNLWASYDQYIDHSLFRKIFWKLDVKSYSDFYNEVIDRPHRYIAFRPSVSFHRRQDADSHKYKKFTLRVNHTYREQYSVAEEKSTYTPRTLYQFLYNSYNFNELAPRDFLLALEFQSYKPLTERQHYLKLTTSYKQDFLYASKKKISTRLYASYFILNTQRESASYNNLFTQGSSALIHQGFNDYAYDESWYNRLNQDAILSNQVSYAGGGFKTPFGSAYNLGMTNDFSVALNLEADLPLNMPDWLPLGVYFDIGYYTSKQTLSEDLTGKTLFSSGLSLNYGEGLFAIYLPLINSSQINSIYTAEDTNILGRVSFRLDINRFNPWELIEDYNF